jgi:hypothetical protein
MDISGRLTQGQLDYMAERVNWLRANESDDYRKDEALVIEYARERAARERCAALLLPTEIMNLDCGLVDFEATASDEGGAIVRGQGDTATEAWLALGDALERRR